MCKLLIIPHAARLSQERAKRLIAHMHPKMTERDSDGFGYAMLTEHGLYTERFLRATRIRPMLPRAPQRFSRFLEPLSTSHGEAAQPIGGLMLHSRMSTNVVSLEATHPFVEGSTALIHNGVVSNIGEEVHAPSGNDSEMLFKHYLKGGIEHLSKSVSGYYACGVLDASKRQCVVFKDSTAQLYGTYSRKLRSLVFATTPEILEHLGKFLKEHARIFRVKDNVHLTFNASGKLIEERSFTPIARRFGKLDALSLGESEASMESESALAGYGYDWQSLASESTSDIPSYREDAPARSDDDLETYCEDEYGRELTEEQYDALDAFEQSKCLFYTRRVKEPA